jgi:hypothetical protein
MDTLDGENKCGDGKSGAWAYRDSLIRGHGSVCFSSIIQPVQLPASLVAVAMPVVL